MSSGPDIFTPAEPARLLTTDNRSYPVGRIFCASHNYRPGGTDSRNCPEREPPVYFTKFADALVNADPADRTSVPYPPETTNYHFGVELVVALGRPGFRLSPAQAANRIWGYGCGLDMTRRDLQREARDTGRPWDAGKNIEQSCPMGRLSPVEQTGHITRGPIRLWLNDEERQSADLADLIWNAAELVADLSLFYHLRPGDLIFTGTPAGSGPVEPDDRIRCEIAGLPALTLHIADEE